MTLSILCVGLPRTGTTSLVRALKTLGLRAIHYHPERLLDVARRCDWRVYDDVDAAADFPASPFYRQVLAAYPDARCVLTLREPRDAWIDSVLGYGQAMYGQIQEEGHLRFMEAVGRVWWDGDLGPDLRGALARCYDRWLAQVRTDVPPERLLTLNIPAGDGWRPLCQFLGRPFPDVPFPWENRRPSGTPGSQGRGFGGITRTAAPR